MNVERFVGAMIIAFFTCIFSGVAFGVPPSAVLILESHNPLKLSVSEKDKLYKLSMPSDFMLDVDGLYDHVYVEDLTGDGVGEVVFRLTAQGVNVCSRVLNYNSENRILNELIFDRGGLCNYKVRSGYIVSAYKSGAVWVEDVYVVENGKVNIDLSDRCLGCGEVNRVKYSSNGSSVKSLVTDDINFEKRIILTANVLPAKAEVFSAATSAQLTEKFLVRGDKVVLVVVENVNGEEWVQIRLSGTQIMEGWMRRSDLDFCNRF